MNSADSCPFSEKGMPALRSASLWPPPCPSSSIGSLEKDELERAVEKEWNLNEDSTSQELASQAEAQVLGGSPLTASASTPCRGGRKTARTQREAEATRRIHSKWKGVCPHVYPWRNTQFRMENGGSESKLWSQNNVGSYSFQNWHDLTHVLLNLTKFHFSFSW